jgi:hypothetical protein
MSCAPGLSPMDQERFKATPYGDRGQGSAYECAHFLAIVGLGALGLAKLGVDRVPGTLSWKSDNVTVSTYLRLGLRRGPRGSRF